MSKNVMIWQLSKAWQMPWKVLAGILGHAPTEMQDGLYADDTARLTDADQAWCEATAKACGMWAPSDILAGRI
jgi:hypothetical protein